MEQIFSNILFLLVHVQQCMYVQYITREAIINNSKRIWICILQRRECSRRDWRSHSARIRSPPSAARSRTLPSR